MPGWLTCLAKTTSQVPHCRSRALRRLLSLSHREWHHLSMMGVRWSPITHSRMNTGDTHHAQHQRLSSPWNHRRQPAASLAVSAELGGYFPLPPLHPPWGPSSILTRRTFCQLCSSCLRSIKNLWRETILYPSNSKFRHFITFLGHLVGEFPLVSPGVKNFFEEAQDSDSMVETVQDDEFPGCRVDSKDTRAPVISLRALRVAS